MTEEVRAIMSFGQLKRGDRLQVDIHDPVVAGLIRGGYLKINWKEPRRGETDRAGNPDGPDRVPVDRVDSGAARGAEEEELDGPRTSGPGQGDSDSAPAGQAAGEADK